MSLNKNIELWKLIAAGAALVYLYKMSKSQGLTMAQNPDGVQVKTKAFVNLASQFVPPEYRQEARNVGHQIMNKIMEY